MVALFLDSLLLVWQSPRRCVGEIAGLRQRVRNIQDGISLIQTVEGALDETHAILHRMRELAVRSSSDTFVPSDRREIQNELTPLVAEVDRIATGTEFNTEAYLDGSLKQGLSFAFGVGTRVVNLTIGDMSATGLGLSASSDRLDGGVE